MGERGSQVLGVRLRDESAYLPSFFDRQVVPGRLPNLKLRVEPHLATMGLVRKANNVGSCVEQPYLLAELLDGTDKEAARPPKGHFSL